MGYIEYFERVTNHEIFKIFENEFVVFERCLLIGSM